MGDRTNQAITLLKQSKAEGKSFFAAKQALVENGYTNEEIGEATDQFDYKSYAAENDLAGTKSHDTDKQSDSTVAPSSIYPEATKVIDPLRPGARSQDITPDMVEPIPLKRSWIYTGPAQAASCLIGMAVVWQVGGKALPRTHGTLPGVIFLFLVALEAALISYYAFIAKVMVVNKWGRQAMTPLGAYFAGVVWLAALAYTTLLLITRYHWG